MIRDTEQSNEREDKRPVLLKLFGEFDVRYQRTLEDVLSECVESGRPAFIDLFDVTFMDSRCVRELAIHYLLGDGRLILCDPSQEVRLSVAACDLEDWLDFAYADDPAGEEERPTDRTLRLVRDEELVVRVGNEAPTRCAYRQLNTMIGTKRKAIRTLGWSRSKNGATLGNGRILVIDMGTTK
jgi:anti-anti-sigma factor